MDNKTRGLIHKAYAAFNARDITGALTTMHPDVHWPKAFEGGYVIGPDEIRKYWTRQWSEIDPHVEPAGFTDRPDGTLEVQVHQTVKDLQQHVLFDGIVKHIYSFEEGLIKKMDVETE